MKLFTIDEVKQIIKDAQDNYDLSCNDQEKLGRTALEAMEFVERYKGLIDYFYAKKS